MRSLTSLWLLACALPLFAQNDYHKTAVTRWAGPGEPMTYAQYLALHPPQPLVRAEIKRLSSGLDQTGPLLIVIEQHLLTPLQVEVDRYMDDLVQAGWEPILISQSGGTAAQLRGILQQYWASDAILGAVLIGDLPQGWFELYEDFDNDGLPDSPYQVQFPCDLYYMDLDGDWYDGDLDGVLDTHLNAWQPDIFVGQLISSTLGNEIELLRNYFEKNHSFRMGQLYLPGVGLAYIDDDWSGGASQWGAALAQAVGWVEIIGEPDSTTADDYYDHLDNGYYSILLASHSSPELHTMKEQGGTVWDNLYNWEITQTDPDAYFYNLFCCSACRYNETSYIGGCYLFADTYAQGVVGSTKTGSMLYFEDYYAPIAEGECLGEALRQWLALHGQEEGSLMWAMSWFYGMTHLGDPTLFMQVGLEIAAAQVIDDGSAGSSGDGDGLPEAGETIALDLTVQNNDPTAHAGVWIKLSSSGAWADWLVDSVYVGDIGGGNTALAAGFLVQIDEQTPDNTILQVSAQIWDAGGHLWGDAFNLTLRAPDLVLTSFDMQEISGDGDPYADPGEQFELTLQFQNQGGDDSEPTSFVLNSLDSRVETAVLVSGLPALAPGQIGSSAPPCGVVIAEACPPILGAPIQTIITGETGTPCFLFQVGYQLAWNTAITSPEEALQHYSLASGYFDQWHVSTSRSSTAPFSMKYGSYGSLNYAAMSDGALETPLFMMGNIAQLSFQHWMEAEAGYDGGMVEINLGQGWQALTPQGGYPGVSQSNGSFPGGPCYNGALDWSEPVFDLSGHPGFARLRFRFGSDGGVEGEGWFVDDISLSGDLFSGFSPPATPGSKELPLQFSLSQNHPNPFNPITVVTFTLPAACPVKIEVFDIRGQKVWRQDLKYLPAGAHQVVFDGSGLAAGIYFYHLETGASKASGKMVLMK